VNLPLEDQQHLTAATGWLELGDHISAFEELEKIDPLHRAHPDVLKLRWRVYAKARRWDCAFAVADGLTRVLPDEPEPFIWRSYAARLMPGGGLEQALQLLLDVATEFPDETAVPFDLARYNSQLGKLTEARNWLHIAFEVAERNGTAKIWKGRALDEKDLKRIWTEIGAT
jgi:tetratricopeptide (TPR) repeat protein